MAGTILDAAWRSYLRSLSAQPLATKACTSACVAGLSDLIAQAMGRASPSGGWVWRRTAAIMAYGLLWNGPGGHYWQKFMEKLFKGKTDLGTVLKKVGGGRWVGCARCHVGLARQLRIRRRTCILGPAAPTLPRRQQQQHVVAPLRAGRV